MNYVSHTHILHKESMVTFILSILMNKSWSFIINKHCNRAYITYIFKNFSNKKNSQIVTNEKCQFSLIMLFIIDAHSLAGTKRGASHTIFGTFAVTFAGYLAPAAYE